MATPPAAYVRAADGNVRAASYAEADRVSRLLDRLAPEVVAMIPGGVLPDDLEVWIQETPRLYAMPGAGVADAEGLWSERHHRVMLGRNADDMERTLAHELTHAALDGSWHRLPGTIEEGLCDAVSASLVESGAARLRAGRLSSAALACGGLGLHLDLSMSDTNKGWTARVRLTGEDTVQNPQQEVFRIQAGLSSTRLSSSTKRGFYGMAFLLAERTIDRIGMDGLYELCERAAALGHSQVPRPWLLEAADLPDDANVWRTAAAAAMGERELVELVRMYPDFAANSITAFVGDADLSNGWPEHLVADISLDQGPTISLDRLDFLIDDVRDRQALRLQSLANETALAAN
tara:strand:- start:1701 stop:2744 length:1044 start_codon:yes stop_codon:yes gene_type:complete